MLRRLIQTLAITATLSIGIACHARETPAIGAINVIALPPEAQQTLRLIAHGGPFPYRKDGVVFHNRERRLPARERGCYREYTVPTPDENDRGARRIVTSCDGDNFYTSDHYRSFRRIRP